jgi:hypothetical protein
MQTLIGSELGGCKIESKIGQGGMGAVYKAHHLALDIPVAVKVLQPIDAIEGARERFLREARIAARLRHPHIVGVLNVGTERNLDFIVMEYVEGKSLGDLLKEQGKIPAPEAVRIGIEILGALQEAHQNGIVHRDVKPENIMIDTSGSSRLADLGLARVIADVSLTQTSMVLGSPHYVAPEQAEKPSAADIRADIYSLGCTIFHMITGAPPFKGESIVEIVLNHIKMPVPDIRDLEPSTNPQLCAVVMRMMSKDPSARYPDPATAIAALKTCTLSGLSATKVAGQPLPVRSGASKNVKFAMATTTAAVVVLVAGMLMKYMLENRSVPVPQQPPTAVITPVDSTLFETGATQETTSVQQPQPALKKIARPVHKPPDNQVVKVSGTTVAASQVDPLMQSVKLGDTETIRRLLNEGAAPNAQAGAATTPLHEAVRRGNTTDVQLLLDKGANPNVRDTRGDAPIHYALRENARMIVRMLLEKGADPNLGDSRGTSPLRIAESIDSELESMLRQRGAR